MKDVSEHDFPAVPPAKFRFRGRCLECGGSAGPLLMGILNVTPDSFSDGGLHMGETSRIVEYALKMQADGAAIIDVGGESTRPGFVPVDAEAEMTRIIPVIEGIRRHSDVPVSVDTSKAVVARAALQAGADIVNDVSAMSDPAMWAVVAEARAGCVLMHNGPVEGGNAVASVRSRLDSALRRAMALTCLSAEYFAVDPGIGFGKEYRDNLELLAGAGALSALGSAVLLAFSRKSCIGTATGEKNPGKRVAGTIAVSVMTRRKCHILRVHDVAEVKQALDMADALNGIRMTEKNV